MLRLVDASQQAVSFLVGRRCCAAACGFPVNSRLTSRSAHEIARLCADGAKSRQKQDRDEVLRFHKCFNSGTAAFALLRWQDETAPENSRSKESAFLFMSLRLAAYGGGSSQLLSGANRSSTTAR